MNDKVQEMMDAQDIGHIEDLANEYGKLKDWFAEEFPESTLNLEVNSDQRYATLSYKLTVMSGRDLGKNQLHFTNTLTITKQQWHDFSFMSTLKKRVYPAYKKSISKALNEHYQKEKEKENV